MQNINEQLEALEADGKQYAHFFSHHQYPGYYGVLIRAHTPEYIALWMPDSPLAGYQLACSIEMADDTFVDYLAELFPDQKSVSFLKTMYAMELMNVELANTWAVNFKIWKQEKIRLNRVKWLEQYPWVTTLGMHQAAGEKS